MKISIDGREIQAPEGSSILTAALDAGIFIPHLCSHPNLEARGGCRLCSVEIEGQSEAVPACMTKAEDGMVINIYGEKANRIRKTAMELILATHPSECTGCPKYGTCELQSMYQYLGVGPERWRKQSRTLANDDSNPLIRHLFSRCVRCGRCIRACQDLRGVKVLDYIKDSAGVHAGIPEGKSLKEAGCRFCGACIEVCPTGSIMDALGIMKDDQPYTDSVVPCQAACPAHIDIPRYIRYIKNGEFEKAAAVIREKVPFPKTLGSICSHDCENECKRNHLGEPVSICKLKLAAASEDSGKWKEKRICRERTGKRAAVIGGGPAGLTAAYYLAKQGHEVTVFEANEKAGGQCRYGIPAYRLPDELLDQEIADILEVGIELKTSTPQMHPGELLEQGFAAVLVAAGTHQGTILPLEGHDLEGTVVNTKFLKAARMGNLPPVGTRVVVLGGGNVAYDCARTALRSGAGEVHLVCLETQDQMPAAREEVEEGAKEGVLLHAGYSFLRIVGEQRVEGVEIQRINQFYFDEDRKAIMELAEGTNETIAADQVIFAVGQKPEGTEVMGLELAHGTYIQVNEQSETSRKGIFAAGDVVTGTKSVIAAIAAGRKAAKAMDIYLGGDGHIEEVLTEEEAKDPYLGQCPGFAELKRETSVLPLDQEAAKCEAGRCLQCDLRLDIERPKLWNEY